MLYFNRNGVWFTIPIEKDAIYSRELLEKQIHTALLAFQNLKDRSPGLDQMRFEKPGQFVIKSVFGNDEVTINPKTISIGPRRIGERSREFPVPVYILGDNDANLLGVFACAALSWKSVAYMQRETDEGELEKRPELYFDNGPSDLHEKIHVYPLTLISATRKAEETFDTEETTTSKWGENEDYDSPEVAVLGPGTWNVTGWGVESTEINGGDVFIYRFPNCMYNYNIGHLDIYTGNYHTNHLIAMWSGAFGDPPPAAPTWPVDGIQHWTKRYTSTSSATITAENGDIIVSDSYSHGSITHSIGNLNYGGECESETTEVTFKNGTTPEILYDCGFDPEGLPASLQNKYDSDTYLITYIKITDEYTQDYQCSPWIHWPQLESLVAGNYVESYSESYWVVANGKWGRLEYEFAPPYTGDEDYRVDVYQVEIYDFHGSPVYIWSWKDFRDNTANYGMIYQEKVYISDAFPIDSDGYPDTHDVYGSFSKFGMKGSLFWGAKVAGIEIKNTFVI